MIECPREHDVLEALSAGPWDAASGDLRAHVEACAICGDVVAVAGALRTAHRDGCASAAVPSAGLVWWRATIRARAEAARTAEQPITVARIIGAACIAGALCALAISVWTQVPELPHVSATALVALVVAVGVVFTPLALVLALSRD
ncbi:MAG: hypothetical protein ACHQO8_11190 [Vicinamibacterales bacterium]